MKKIFALLLVLLLIVPIVVADSCDDFCQDEEYDYGECRETTEDEGFCEGEDEDVYGFTYCEDLERCCCGNEEVEEEADEADDEEETTEEDGEDTEETSEDEETTEDNATEDTEEECECECTTVVEWSVEKTLFWFLLALVAILAIAYYTTRNDEEEVIDEL